MRVLVCGSRNWPEYGPAADVICNLLQGMYDVHEMKLGTVSLNPLTIISGGAMGADTVAAMWAQNDPLHYPAGKLDPNFGVPILMHEEYLAEWPKFGKAAGPIRNERMLREGKPDVVYAFNYSQVLTPGTKNMIQLARDAKIPTFVTFYWNPE